MIMHHSRLMIEHRNNPSSPLIVQYVDQNCINSNGLSLVIWRT